MDEREYVARQLARFDDKDWEKLPNISTLWFKDKLYYRDMAKTALSARKLWQMNEDYNAAHRRS